MIYVDENKSVLCKGDFHPAQLYKGNKKITGYELTEFEGIGSVTLENCYNDKVYDAQIIGNTIQDGTPTPENPIEVQSVGELVTEGEYEGKYKILVTARGKNYFDVDKIPFNTSTTQPYNNGLTAKKVSSLNRGNKIPVSLPVGRTIHVTMDVVDSKIDGTWKRVTMGFFNDSNTLIGKLDVTSTIGHQSYSATLSEEVSYIQFYFQYNNTSNADGDYVTMDNIMLRCEGDDTYEPYIEPQMVNIHLDEPLRRVENYSDYIDYEAKKIIRNIASEYITKVDSLVRSFSPNYTYLSYISKKPKTSNREFGCISNKFSNGADYTYSEMKNKENIIQTYITTAGVNAVVYTFDGKYTLEEAQELIGDGFDVCYILAEATEEAVELPKLPTFKGTTIYEVDTEITATISGKYKKMEG